MAHLVAVQTQRGTNGTVAAQNAVETALAVYNTANPNAQHVAVHFVVLPLNTKGMQFALSLYAQLARLHGCTLIRNAVHGGACSLVGPATAVAAVQAAYTPAYNAAITAAAAAYNAAVHGQRMAFTNGYTCGAAAALTNAAPALAYGIGMLHTFAAPGNGTAYGIGAAAAPVATAPTATAAPAPRKQAATSKAA